MVVSPADTSRTVHKANLQAQLDRLDMDDELGRVVREGLNRLPAAEFARVASDLEFALEALKPALAQLDAVSPATGLRIGLHIVVKGELHGAEDLLINGRVEGIVRVPGFTVTIGTSGSVAGEIVAARVIVHGLLEGPVRATEKVDLRDGARVVGNISAPGVAIAEGAEFNGSVDMRPSAVRERPPAVAAARAVQSPLPEVMTSRTR